MKKINIVNQILLTKDILNFIKYSQLITKNVYVALTFLLKSKGEVQINFLIYLLYWKNMNYSN